MCRQSTLRVLVGALFLFGVGLAPAAEAAGGALERARSAYASLEYEGCRSEAEAALTEPSDRKGRVDAYRLLGLCQAALGDTEAAREAFIRMLAIDPEAKLPDGLSPRFTSSYLEAKGYWVGQETLALELEGERIEGEARVVRVRIVDPLSQVARVSHRTAGGALFPPLRAAPRMELEVPADEAVEIVALDEHGGEVALLALSGLKREAPNPTPPPSQGETVERTEEDGGLWLWIGVGAGAALLVASAAAAGLGAFFYEPTEVRLSSQVVFGDQE